MTKLYYTILNLLALALIIYIGVDIFYRIVSAEVGEIKGNEVVMVQVFEGTDDLDLDNTAVRFLDEPFELPLAPTLLGRVFNGIGSPRDSRPAIVSDATSLRRAWSS